MPLALIQNIFNISGETIQFYLIRILVLCISLSFHERSHAWAAYKLGDDTAALQGRLSLNPLVHLDLIGSLAFIIGGIGWAKPVPINPIRFDRKYSIKKGIILSSAAGPLANLFLAVMAAVLFFITETILLAAGVSSGSQIGGIILNIIIVLYYSNIVLAVFNLLPVPPLDGFKVFGAVLPNRIYYKLMQYERYIGLVFLALILLGRSVLSSVLSVISVPFNIVIWQPLNALFTWFWQAVGIV